MNTVLRMFIDIFSHPDTAGMFYTNDIKVLIDIVVRQLSDLDAGSSVSASSCISASIITSTYPVFLADATLLPGAVPPHFAQHQLPGAPASQARPHEDLHAHLLRGDRVQCLRSAAGAGDSQRVPAAVQGLKKFKVPENPKPETQNQIPTRNQIVKRC